MGGSGSRPPAPDIKSEDPDFLVVDKSGDYVRVSDSVVHRILGQPDPQPQSKGFEEVHYDQQEIQRQLEKQFQKRLHETQEKHFMMKKAEFAKAVEEVEGKLLRQSGSPVCQDLQKAVFYCYQNFPNETLKCSEEAKAFTDCVQKARQVGCKTATPTDL